MIGRGSGQEGDGMGKTAGQPPRSRQAGREEEADQVPLAPPCAMVIFGAGGDLTRRLVVPALYNLVKAGRLPEPFRLVGLDLAEQAVEDWRAGLTETMKGFVGRDGEFQVDHLDETAWRWLIDRMSYLQGDLNAPDTYRRLGEHLAELDRTAGTAGNHLFYLAIADRFFATAVAGLGAADLTRERDGRWRRVVIEKPFGHDVPSAIALNTQIRKTLQEPQIYRIDHFLGKETVQNIMALRFANGLFEPLWSRQHIDHVQITAAETVGVEHRGKFYERTGALRDMVPNHMFQLLAMTAMEPPTRCGPRRPRSSRPSCRSGPRAPSGTRCAASTAPAPSWASRSARTARSPTWRPTRARRPTWPASSRSTTGGGPACRSTCAPASTWSGGGPRWPSASTRRRTRCSGAPTSSACIPTG
jgi:hypothetical protein